MRQVYNSTIECWFVERDTSNGDAGGPALDALVCAKRRSL